MADEIIRDLWRIKDTIAEEYGWDVKSFVAHLRGKKHEGEEVVDLRSMKQAAEQNAEADARPRGSANPAPSTDAA